MTHPPPVTASPEADVITPTWELERLQPPTETQLRLAHRVGVDPNVLLVRFTERYQAAVAKDYATINAIVGDEHAVTPQYTEMSDHLNQIAEDRREEWWVAPVEAVARLLAPGADTRPVAEAARRSMFVGLTVRVNRPTAPRQVARADCPRSEHRPATRRTSSSSRSSSADPGDDGPGEPPAASLRLAPPPRAVLTFGCLSADERGADTEQVSR